jgi:hypothetical protein
MLVNHGDYEGATRAIEAIKLPLKRPSLDGVSALRSVGEWLAVQGRWHQAASRFSALMEIDKLDLWGPVTLDYQSCGVVLVESGDLEGFERFRQDAMARFVAETNGDAAGRILKTCLLLPPDETLKAQMKSLGVAAETFFTNSDPKLMGGWSVIPVGLWRYRCGDYGQAAEWCRQCLDESNKTAAQQATIRIILAMCNFRTGQTKTAGIELAQAREAINLKFQQNLNRGDGGVGYWYDWAFARVLLREAEGLIK